MNRLLPWLAGLLVIGVAGCDNPQTTVKTLREDIKAFRANPSREQQAQIEQKFAKLDAQINRLAKSGKSDEVANLKRQAFDLQTDYQAARFAQTVNDAKNAVQGIGDAVRDAGKSFGDLFRPASPDQTPQE